MSPMPPTPGMGHAVSQHLDSSSESFVQARVAREGIAGFFLSGTALVFRVIGGVLLRDGSVIHPSMIGHSVATALLLALFLLHRGPARRAPGFVRATELGLLVACSTAMSSMILYIPLEARPDMIALLAMTLIALARAVLVPSTPGYTRLLTILMGVPVIAFSGVAAHRLPYAPYGDPTVVLTISAACWWSLTVASASFTTRVIFGLRREVHEAKRLGQYVLLEKIGEGGMGSVYRAQHALLRRPTAIKLLPADRNAAEDVARFEREVRLTASLTHPNTVTVFDYGRTPDGTFYYAMELLDGPNLEQIVDASGPMPPARVVHVLAQVTAALIEAHAAGLVHRDVKPANVLLCRRGGADDVAKVVDFGLVKRVDPDGTGGDPSQSRADRITGTPLYLSPEAITRPADVGPASDLYALGATAYFLLTGAPPFVAQTVVELYAAHLHKDPEPPSRKLEAPLEAAAAQLEALVLSMLAKDPTARPASAADVHATLAALAHDLPWSQADARACRIAHAETTGTPSPLGRTVAIDLAART
jgi:serine/threonine-protein kinase